MRVYRSSLAIAAACALAACAAVSSAQWQNASSAAGRNSAGADRSAAVSSAMGLATASGMGAGQGTGDSSDATQTNPAMGGASKWIAGATSFTVAGSGGWTPGKQSFGAESGVSWTAGAKSFAQPVQRGGIWRVDSSALPGISAPPSATTPATLDTAAPGAEASPLAAGAFGGPGAAGESFPFHPTGVMPVRANGPKGFSARGVHGYSHSMQRASAKGAPFRRPGARQPGFAAHATGQRNTGFGRSAGSAGQGTSHGLEGGMPGDSGVSTPSLTDPALIDPDMNDSVPDDPLSSGLPQ